VPVHPDDQNADGQRPGPGRVIDVIDGSGTGWHRTAVFDTLTVR
jgi:hypothetical protein